MEVAVSLAIALALALAIALAAGRLLGRTGRRRRRGNRHQPPEELYGLAATGVPLARSHADDEELELEDGSLDPDELEGDPLVWDEGADDELG